MIEHVPKLFRAIRYRGCQYYYTTATSQIESVRRSESLEDLRAALDEPTLGKSVVKAIQVRIRALEAAGKGVRK